MEKYDKFGNAQLKRLSVKRLKKISRYLLSASVCHWWTLNQMLISWLASSPSAQSSNARRLAPTRPTHPLLNQLPVSSPCILLPQSSSSTLRILSDEDGKHVLDLDAGPLPDPATTAAADPPPGLAKETPAVFPRRRSGSGTGRRRRTWGWRRRQELAQRPYSRFR
jgi:hypothetical protein